MRSPKCPRCGLGIDVSGFREPMTKEEVEKLVGAFTDAYRVYQKNKTAKANDLVWDAHHKLIAALTGKEE